LAGKKVKCKCGHALSVPTPPSIPLDSDDPFADALSALADAEDQGATRTASDDAPRCPSCMSQMQPGAVLCVNCGHHVATGKKVGVKVEKAAKKAVAVAGGGDPENLGRPGVLAYSGRSQRAAASAGDNNIGEPFKDLYLPIILFLAGVALTFVEARFAIGIPSTGFCVAYTGVITIINLVLVFVGIMFAARLLDLGLGPIGPALLKIAAIAVLPGAAANIVGHALGPAGGMLGWGVSLALIYGMFMGLLQLDGQETIICSTIIWLVRTWAGFFLAMAIMNGFGMVLANAAATVATKTSPSASNAPAFKMPPPPKIRQVTVAQLDAAGEKALASGKAVEVRAWMNEGEGQIAHVVPNAWLKDTNHWLDDLFKAGAVKMTVTRVRPSPQNGDLEARQVVVTLPDDKAARERVFTMMWYNAEAYGAEFFNDRGQKYILLDYDVKGPAEEPATTKKSKLLKDDADEP
jgi:hypothetical protein